MFDFVFDSKSFDSIYFSFNFYNLTLDHRSVSL